MITYMQRMYFILIAYLLLGYYDSYAQPYLLKHLGVEDGLSNNYVTNITQDKQGYIWIATESGLSRFDGRNFTTYKDNDSGIISNALNALLYDEEENALWIGLKDGLSKLDCSTYQFTNNIADSIASNIVALAHSADNKGIWITNHYGGTIYYNKQTKQFSPFSHKNIKDLYDSSWCSFDNGHGSLYIGHAQGGLSIIDLKSKTCKNYRNDPHNPKSLPGNSVYCIYIDHSGNIWIGTNQGLALFNSQTEEFLTFKHEFGNPHSLIADHIYCIKEMNDGTLWIGADIGGISILDLHNITFMNPKSMKFTNISASNDESGLSSSNIRSLLQDSFGNIWIGNYSSGINFISHTKPVFHTLPYTTEKGKTLKNKPVWGISTDKEGQVWVGSENEVAIFKDYQLTKTLNITPFLSRPYGQVFSLRSDQKQTFLLGIYDDGLLKLNTKTNRIERIPLGMDNIDIITFFEDSDGTMLIGAEYGVYIYENGTARVAEEITNQLYARSVYGILRDRQGKLWIGTYGGGISIFDKDNKLTMRLNTDNGFCSNAINQLYLNSQGEVWVATRNGIAHIKNTMQPEHFEAYNSMHGLDDNFVRAIQEDKAGNIWISTNDGISRWNSKKQLFENYNHHDGIPAGNFIEGSACSTEDGILYFGSLNGVCYFDPKELITEHQVAPVQITECKGFNRQIESHNAGVLIPTTNGNIDLPYNQNSFRISFTVPDYSQSQLVEYAYMIEGLENVWANTQGENQVTFRNIAPGEYTFKVKAKLKNQDWDEGHIASMTVHIHPPFWLTWYAKLFYFIIICIAIYLSLRTYKRKLNLESSLELERKNSQNKQELNNERLRFYTNVTHELRTPLTLILGPLEDLLNDPDLSPRYNQKISIIHSSAIRLLNLINELLEFRKTETQNRQLTVSKSNLANLITEIGLRYKELNQNKKVTFHIDIETEKTQLYFDTDMITSIVNNLLSNAIKYTPEGDIRLALRTITEENNLYTEIEVSDTGYGIDSEALPHIFDRYYQAKGKHQASGTGIGLALVKSLAELHQGILNVKSETGKGTSFTFRILTENTYPDALHKEEGEEPLNMTENDVDTEDSKEETDTRPIILAVEDNDDIREYIASSFHANYQVITAINGKEGWELAQKYIPNIIISDIMMPVMDGIELCRSIKEDMRTSHIPVILLTAKDSIQNKEEGYDSGADSYLTKPFSAKLLNSRIHNLLESRKKLAQQITAHTQELEPKALQEPMEPIELNKLDREFLEKLTHIIEENLDAELDIPFMTSKIGMSHSTFYRKVKALTGISANEFIRKVRLKNSLQLLLTGTYNISEAAYMTGFNNVSYYRQCFKDEYGMSPTEYLKSCR